MPRAVPLLSILSLALFSCERDIGPCLWNGQQDRESGAIAVMSLVCDGVATDPALIHVRYIPTSTPLQLTLDTPTFTPTLMFEPALPDGTYSIEATTGETPYDPNKVMTSGAELSGTFTFTRSRDVPFADIAEPEAKPYTSTIDATFNLVAVLPHPDPSMGTGCRLETGEQHVMLSVSGPVEECTSHPTLGAH